MLQLKDTINPYERVIFFIENFQLIRYCFEVFFRIKVLIYLGLSKELIRKRFSYDRRFVAYYENLFGQTIKAEDCGTGEYDDIMQSI